MFRRILCRSALLIALLAASTAGAQSTAKRPLPPPRICIGSNCATTVTSGSGPIKWNPGHYMASNSVIFAGQDITRIQGEMDEINGWDKILGYRVWITWSALEPNKDQYNFAVLDAILNRLKTQYNKPKRLVIVIMPGTFAAPMRNNSSNTIPAYILNGSEYGPSPIAGSYGWWGMNAGGVSTGAYHAAFFRPAVMNRFIALINALGAHYDSDPNVEAFMIQEDSWMVGAWVGAPDYSKTAFMPMMQQLLSASTAAFPHTNVVLQNTWLTTQQATMDLEAWMVANRVAPGAADVLGLTGLQGSNITRLPWGLLSFAGIPLNSITPTDLRSRGRALVDVEAPDICGPKPIYGGPYTPEDIINALNTIYGASHAFWTHLSGKEGWNCPIGSNWSNLAATVSAHPLTNESYPPNYP